MLKFYKQEHLQILSYQQHPKGLHCALCIFERIQAFMKNIVISARKTEDCPALRGTWSFQDVEAISECYIPLTIIHCITMK
jgi:hypothetical protein